MRGLERKGDAITDAEPRRGTRFAWWLAAFTVAGLVLRVIYVLDQEHVAIGGDGFHYLGSALLARAGRWFEFPLAPHGPDAHHPPLWTVILGTVSSLRGSLQQLQLTAVAIGTAAIVLVGLAGRKVAGPRVGLCAAALCAVHPGFWQYERELLSEVALLPLVAVVLLLAYRYHEAPSLLRIITLSAACALAALTRAEQVALFPILVVPLVVATRTLSWASRIGWLAASAAVAVVLIGPWAAYNTARFDEPVFLSTGLGTTMIAGACDATFSGDLLGSFDTPTCFHPRLPELRDADRSEADLRMRRAALDYSREHLSDLPRVVAAREARTFGLYRPFQEARLASEWTGSPSWVRLAGTWMYWGLLPFAVAGAFILRRRHVLVYPLLVEFLIVVVVAAGTFGLIRYRAAVEVPFVILAAVAIDAAWSRLRRRRSDAEVSTHTRTDQPVTAAQGRTPAQYVRGARE